MGAGRRIASRTTILAVAVAAVLAVALAGGRLLGARRAERSFQEQHRGNRRAGRARLPGQGRIQPAGRRFLGQKRAGLAAAAEEGLSASPLRRAATRSCPASARRASAAIPGSRLAAPACRCTRACAPARHRRSGRRAVFPRDPTSNTCWRRPRQLRQEPASPRTCPLSWKACSPPDSDRRPASLQALAARWQDEALLQDAGLAWMAAGDTGRAAAAFRELPDGPDARGSCAWTRPTTRAPGRRRSRCWRRRRRPRPK